MITEISGFINGKHDLQVIGVLQNGIIYTGNKAIALFKEGRFDDVISLARAKLMSAMYLGYKWDELARQHVCIELNRGKL